MRYIINVIKNFIIKRWLFCVIMIIVIFTSNIYFFKTHTLQSSKKKYGHDLIKIQNELLSNYDSKYKNIDSYRYINKISYTTPDAYCEYVNKYFYCKHSIMVLINNDKEIPVYIIMSENSNSAQKWTQNMKHDGLYHIIGEYLLLVPQVYYEQIMTENIIRDIKKIIINL